mgnify:CR=1 FL=1
MLSDMLPGPVAEMLKRKALQHGHEDGAAERGTPGGAAGGKSALVYKQWHPAVSVLFAGGLLPLLLAYTKCPLRGLQALRIAYGA